MLSVLFMAQNGLSCADVLLRNYSLPVTVTVTGISAAENTQSLLGAL